MQSDAADGKDRYGDGLTDFGKAIKALGRAEARFGRRLEDWAEDQIVGA